MRKKNGLDKVMKDCGLNLDEDIIFIEELIQGRTSSDSKWTAKGRPENKSFLYEIVANKLNGIDVDKWDYLARDCHYLGIPNGFDHQRLLKSARVCKVDGRNHICFRDKVADDVYGMFHTRYTLHRQALQHKIGYIIDIKMKEALVRADDKLIPDRKISDAIDDILEYTKLTDHIFDQILNQSDSNPRLDEARSILQDIVNRRLPKFVGEARLNEDKLKVKLRDKFKKEKPDNASRITVYQIFNDPIHGQIELHPLLVKIIDTPQFQRLRHIKQLGGTHLVYPGATHTRFEHSLG
ncbi:deoxynucleoside triphosphate triphosphohydrolase SAMHD1-like protein [Labeo rohita]|uniref:Deoxynucleoside triphosphate triphosphohydrolase SAMHD1-like protein n=1 Tax=Labeo rohita TaxID=84645 RepID=A0A498LQ88_LABRO|nr:deoxynucleoside triphosphate triphosphohydrolase SAMHD1-like protein [Labeo rohita]